MFTRSVPPPCEAGAGSQPEPAPRTALDRPRGVALYGSASAVPVRSSGGLWNASEQGNDRFTRRGLITHVTTTKATVTPGRVLARNTIWNAAGQVLPVLVALVTIPILVRGLGVDRFGVLALSWMVVGYFGFLDFGLGRALTKLVAQDLGRGDTTGIPPLVWTALAMMTALGVLGTAISAALTPWLVGRVLSIPPALMAETRVAFYLLALSIPFVMIVAGLRGLLEAHQRFGLVNALRVPLGIFNFVGPAVTLYWSHRIDGIVAVLVVGRVAAALIHFWLCRKVVPSLRGRPEMRASLVLPLVRFGGWMTVSNVISPLMVYFDRFLIGAQIAMSAVAFYVTPYELVTKLSMVPSALVGVLFPAFSSAVAVSPERAALLLDRGIRYVYIVLFPAIVGVVTLASPGLELWLGADFAAQSTRVLQWLAAGVFVNSLAQVPFAFLQGAGRPDLTAKLHFAELPVYLILLWWAVPRFGIVGAAVVWSGRVAIDGILIFAMARELVRGRFNVLHLSISVGCALAVFLLGSLLGGPVSRGVFLTAILGMFLPVSWRFILAEDERAVARAGVRALFRT